MGSINLETTLVSIDRLRSLPTDKGEKTPESVFAIFDDIWAKLLMLAKKLRDTLQLYNQKKQELGWGLEVNTLITKYKAIDESYSSARISAIGSIIGGVATLGIGASGVDAGAMLGQSSGQAVNGVFNLFASSLTREADRERAIADLQDKGAQSYAKTLNETLEKARDAMQQMMSLGRSLVDMLAQVLHALSK